MKKGFLLTLIGGTCWGFSGACGQFLFSHYQVSSFWLASMRMCFAGLILSIASLFVAREPLTTMLRSRHDVIECIIFGICGLAFCQITYLQVIKYSDAGTATVLQYLFPVMIMVLVCLKGRKLPTAIEALCVFLAVGGTFVIATHGHPQTMALSKQGLMWGLISAVSCCFYTLLPRRLMRVYGSVPVTGLGMLSGGIFTLVAFRTPGLYVPLDTHGFLATAAIILIGTALAFTLYLQGVKEIGPVRASMIASIEPVSAAVFAFAWLRTPFAAMDLLGFAMIITTIFLLAVKPEDNQDAV